MSICGINSRFQLLSPCVRQVLHAFLTHPPLSESCASTRFTPLDLHVLGTPPAFILSQDRTLLKISFLADLSALTMKLTSLSRSVPRFPFYCRDCFRFSKTVKNFQVLVCVSLFSYQCAGSFSCARLFTGAIDIVSPLGSGVNIFFVFSAPALAGAYYILSPLGADVNTCF